MKELKIEKLKIVDLVVNENNAKEHPKWQIQQIANSIKEFGFNDPIAIDQDNIIIEGHGRLEAIKLLGYEEIEVIRLDHLTENQKSAYVIAHNKIQANTGFDMDKLIYEMNKLKVEGFDLALTGFEEIEISNFTISSDPNEINLENIETSKEEIKKQGLICPCCGHKGEKNSFLECDLGD